MLNLKYLGEWSKSRGKAHLSVKFFYVVGAGTGSVLGILIANLVK
jgi:hypothetical protein